MQFSKRISIAPARKTNNRKFATPVVRLTPVAAAAACALMTHQAVADTWTWTGTVNTLVSNGNWDALSNGFTNWTHGNQTNTSAPPPSDSNTTVDFPGTQAGNATQDIANPFILNSLVFDGASTAVSSLVGNPLSFVANPSAVPPTIAQNSAFSDTIGENINLGAKTTYQGTGAGTLTISGQISGTGALNLAGTAPIILTGSNNYSGATTLASGRVGAGNGSAFGTGTVTVTANMTLYAANADQSLSNPVVVTSGDTLTIGADPMHARNLTFNGAITGTGASENIVAVANASVDIGMNQQLNGFTLSGPGTFVFSNNTSFSNDTTQSGAVVFQSGSATLTNFTNGGVLFSIAPLTWNGGTNAAAGSVSVDFTATVSNLTSNGALDIPSGGEIDNTAGNLTLGTGSKTYLGTDAAPGGQIVLENGTSLEVNGATLINDGTISGPTDINAGSTVSGLGTYGAVNVASTGVFQPGASDASVSNNGATVASLSGSGTVDNQSGGGPITLTIQMHGGTSTTFSGNIKNTTSSLKLVVAGTGTEILSGTDTYSGGTSVTGGSLVIGAATALPDQALAITGGQVQLSQSIGGVTIKSLSVSGGGFLDVGNNHLFINYGSGDPISTIAGYIASGYAGGAWNGVGINSSTVVANPGYGVGYADSADAGNPAGLSAGTIEIAYTLLGDADLNHIVNGIDFGIVAANFNKGVSRWDQGDFDYNNIVNGIDFGDIAANFNKGTANAADWAALESFAAVNGLMADVPEPVSGAMLMLSAVGLLRRRMRRRLSMGARH